eukprot:TRINITY_DN1248_c0_g1_i2.p1 TRINITY_DN1248_c0_g1~~TRINITY_DN1248_c0_g1_i2.p1  ORF type:complete len:105 (-),score=29.50 TRINITY_DN1248_c0_g1_i2:96-410(-)
MFSTTTDRKLKDAQIRATINQKLVESGEKEVLKELLRTRLVECGWKDDMKSYCKELIRSKGLDSVTVDDLVQESLVRGRATIPDNLKSELLTRIRSFLAENDES